MSAAAAFIIATAVIIIAAAACPYHLQSLVRSPFQDFSIASQS
jgi:hypothetical protein